MFNFNVVSARVESLIVKSLVLNEMADEAEMKLDEATRYNNQFFICDIITWGLESYCEVKKVDIESIDDDKLSKWIEVYLRKEYYLVHCPW